MLGGSGGIVVREGVSRTEYWVPAVVGFAMATASGAAVHDGGTRSGTRWNEEYIGAPYSLLCSMYMHYSWSRVI